MSRLSLLAHPAISLTVFPASEHSGGSLLLASLVGEIYRVLSMSSIQAGFSLMKTPQFMFLDFQKVCKI